MSDLTMYSDGPRDYFETLVELKTEQIGKTGSARLHLPHTY